jgi:MFS family permease
VYDFIRSGITQRRSGAPFFPYIIPYASLMLSFMTFGAGFLVRPVGAVVLGAYVDRIGRRAGLLLTLGLTVVLKVVTDRDSLKGGGLLGDAVPEGGKMTAVLKRPSIASTFPFPTSSLNKV